MAGVKGKRNVERVDISKIDEDFIIDYHMRTAQSRAIEIIYELRAVKMSQLKDITGYSYYYLANMMKELYINRFVERIYPPRIQTQTGSTEAYFMLDKAGAIYLSGLYEVTLKDILWSRRDNLVKYDKLNHTFQIGRVRAAIEKAARIKGDRVINCKCDRHLVSKFSYKDESYMFNPDMFFQYVRDNNIYNYFVEVDTGTMAIVSNSNKTYSFDDKVPVYEKYKISGAYKENFNVYPRVLVITSSTERAEKLNRAVEAKKTTNIEFLFTTMLLWEKEVKDRPFCLERIFIGRGSKEECFDIFK